MSAPIEQDLTRKQRREHARAQRKQLEAAERAAAKRRRRLTLLGGAAAGIVALAAVTVLVASGGAKRASVQPAASAPRLQLAPLASLGPLRPPGAPGAIGPEGVPMPAAAALADTSSKAGGEAVDGIECSSEEQVLFHIHAHLTVFVDGAARQIPYGIGIPGARVQNTPQGQFVEGGSCFYWLHTHSADGIIHIESPVRRTFTLGDFFDIWGEPLSSARVGPAKGRVLAIYNGQHYIGDPREIPLSAHAQIQLDVRTPLVAPVQISFPSGL
jgi:hypothetical protein